MEQHPPYNIETAGISLAAIRPPLKLVRISGLLTRLFEMYFLIVIISFFLGFLGIMSAGEFGQSTFPKFVMYFMYTVMGLVVLMITYKRIKTLVGERSDTLVKNRLLINSLTVIVSAVIIFLSWLIGTTFLGSDFEFSFFVKWIAGLASIFVLLLPYRLLKSLENRYTANYKNMLVDQFLRQGANGIQWSKEAYLPQSDFIQSKIFTFQKIFSYTGSDLFTQDAHQFKGSRLIVQHEEIKKSGGKTEVEISELFNGYLFTADFNKTFHGETYVLPDHARNIFGEIYGEMMNEWVKRNASSLVKLEDPAFEKRFAVYATDATEARYLLSTKLIERINLFSASFYEDIFISFTGNKIYVAVATGKDLLSPHIYSKQNNTAYIQKQLGRLHALLTIPETFDLKTKIWK